MGPVAGLPPGAFAVVMATGIISVVAHEEQGRAHALAALSGMLAWLAAAVYAVLVALSLTRLLAAPDGCAATCRRRRRASSR